MVFIMVFSLSLVSDAAEKDGLLRGSLYSPLVGRPKLSHILNGLGLTKLFKIEIK